MTIKPKYLTYLTNNQDSEKPKPGKIRKKRKITS